ncbi:hypothetical protein K491DRAFT_609549 [Lophiostoma macrostomum CBS 122681]|uniref:UbiA prenyltransferase n=1 Tax=Lophiostoma macrostomum CBS 122681 TaxID=1314788 RepID=A0A6A6SUH2_9PLEO|nr:hypothetical protein K491DRAFT_609549 [Lophiostoma macrostomum CBS 122681]
MRTRLQFEAYTIWLFTRSDLKTIVIPKSIFGVLGALPRSRLVTHTDYSSQYSILRAPLVVVWVWIVLLPFNIDNQRRFEAIEEDKINKPWRPLPSKRLSSRHASQIMLVCHIVGIAYCSVVGGLRQKLAGIVLRWVYNGLGVADRSCIGKNAITALGYVTFSMGALSVAAASSITASGLHWFVMIGCIVFTTVQMQDLIDMEGDEKRARRTLPLVIGSRLCRWSIATLVPFWTLTAMWFWGILSLPAFCSGFAAASVCWRVLNKTNSTEDRLTFRVWNLWIVTLYAMPLASGANR